MTRLQRRIANEEGAALIIALLAMMLLTALAAGLVMVTTTETGITANYRNAQEALYAADAGAERVVEELLMVPRWNDILSGTIQSALADGTRSGVKRVPGGGTVTLCCGTGSVTGQLQAATNVNNQWGPNNPQWQLFAWVPLGDMLPNNQIDSPMYVAVWVADDPAEIDGNPLVDTNGTLTLHAEAYGPMGTRKVIEVTVARTTSTEIERGQVAQRGQEELNQRARKAAVQTPGRALTGMAMGTRVGGMVVQQ